MKIFIYLLLNLWIVYVCVSQTPVLTNGVYTGPTEFSEDPNLNKDWDWEKGDVIKDGVPRYYIFLQNKPNAVTEYEAVLPWYQQSAWTGLEDRKKEDGWILLARDFGSPNRRLLGTNPYFALYNTSRSIVRLFILLMNVPSSFTFSTIELKTKHKDSGALTYLTHVVYALDKIEKTYNNATSVAVSSLAESNYWVYGDFPLGIDNTLQAKDITSIPASMVFDVYGTTLAQVKLETDGFGAQGDKKFISDFMAKNNFGSPGFSLNSNNMPTLDIPFNLPNVHMKATSPDWGSLLKFFDNFNKDLNFGAIDVSNPLKEVFDGFNLSMSLLSIASPIGISGLDLGSLFNFFVGGGMMPANVAQTPPTFISTHYSSMGSMVTKNRFASVTIPIPASRNNYKDPYNGGEVGIVYNEPVGILTLTKTPKILKRKILHSFPNNPPHSQYDFFTEYEVAEDIQFMVNNSSKLSMKSMEAYLVDEFDINSEIGGWLSSRIGSTDQKYLIRLESPINENKILIRSMPVPYKFFKGRKLHLANNDASTVKLKIKAILQKTNDINAQPVVFISTYNVDVTDLGGFNENYHYFPMPTIPPQMVKCLVPTTGGVIVSWDRNMENNIKYYAIERSINGGSYVQIGTTSDTVYTDKEVQKSVKPYLSNRQNVSVSYRIRAKSEWLEDDEKMISQFSNYSDVVTISGSIIGSFDKRGINQIIPDGDYLSHNFPNPFNPTTTIYYGVKKEDVVMIKIFNSLGQEITTLVNDNKEIGYHYAEWNASGLPSGMYFYRITIGNFNETKKMLLLK